MKIFFSNRIDDFCNEEKLARNGSKLVDMIDNFLSRIIELRVVINDNETTALDLQMHCVRRGLMVNLSIVLFRNKPSLSLSLFKEFYERLGHLPM